MPIDSDLTIQRYNVDLLLNEANKSSPTILNSRHTSKNPSICSNFSNDHITSNLINESKKTVTNNRNQIDLKLPQAPMFPPPPPPQLMSTLNPQGSCSSFNTQLVVQSSSSAISVSGQIEATKVLLPPVLPPPPPPLSTLSATQPSFSLQTQQVVSAENYFGQSKNCVRIKIDNETLFDQIVTQLGVDRTKSACALFLCNNDVKLARSLLNFIPKNV